MEFDKYASPESLSPQFFKPCQFEPKEDIWALGLIFYEMIVGANAFDASNANSLIDMVRKSSGADLWIPPHIQVPKNIKYILKKCLEA